jgi:cation:H+ antiporter
MTVITAAWLKLVLCMGLIGFAGPALVRYSDMIAERTGLSRTWIGVVLLATATSLPELFTGLSSVTIAAAPNIAVGDALGSCVLNLAMLVVLDMMHRGEPMYRRADQAHILTAGFGVVLIGFTGAAILFGRADLRLAFFHVGAYTPLIIIIYFVAMRAAFMLESRMPATQPVLDHAREISLTMAATRYLAAATVVAVAGIWLPFVGTEIADVLGLRTAFVGTLLIAGATSLPELVVILSALRFGALDLAISNLLGSNLFDVLILAIDDLAYLHGPLLSAVSPAHAVTAFAAVTMSGIVIVALLYRPVTRFQGTIGWVSLSLLAIYLLSAYAIYLEGH